MTCIRHELGFILFIILFIDKIIIVVVIIITVKKPIVYNGLGLAQAYTDWVTLTLWSHWMSVGSG